MLFNKKSVVITILALFVLTSNCFAKIGASRFKITESEKEFDVIYYVSKDMKSVKNKKNPDVDVTQTFQVKKNKLKGELRYSLFTDCGGDDCDLEIQYAMWVYMCLNNVAGYEVPGDAISSFNDEDVKYEFNGDFGCTAFIQDPKSEYAKGYKYMMVEFFYKKDQGLVMRTFLFNDVAFVGIDEQGMISEDSPLFSNYHSFKFMEKDESGNFIEE
ncbi:MAG: hypothetical protein J6Y69_10655 [Treponema sp.]|nr:hypothetical protein [Treponema sp.]